MATTAEPETTPASPFERLGGHATLQAICDRFYDLMEADPAYAGLRAMHAEDLGPMRKSLPLFLAGWSGGPRDWFEANPGRCMMSVHKPFAISADLATQWADCMRRAIADTAPADSEIGEALADVLCNLALGMGRA